MEIREHVFTPGGKPRKFTDEQEYDVCIEYLSGMSTVKLAIKHNTVPRTINNVLRRRGIERKKSTDYISPDGFVVDGYRWVRVDPGDAIAVALQTRKDYPYVHKHRLVMSQSLGRPLASKEQVHHIDGNRDNNDISNLQLRQGAHGSGVVMVCGDCDSHNIIASPIG